MVAHGDEQCGIDNIESILAPAVYPRGLDYLIQQMGINFLLWQRQYMV
jgi:hypothetical protein